MSSCRSLSMTGSLAAFRALPLRIGKDLFVGRFHGGQALPLAFDNQRIRVVAPHKAAIAPFSRKTTAALDRTVLFIQHLQFCPLVRTNLLDQTFYDNHSETSHLFELPAITQSPGPSQPPLRPAGDVERGVIAAQN